MTEKLARPLAARIAQLSEAPDTGALFAAVSPATMEAAIRALDEGKTHYTDRPGIKPLREWVTTLLDKQFNLDVPPDQVTITCGVTEAEFAAFKVLTRPGSRILVTDNDEGVVSQHLNRVTPLLDAEVVTTADKQLDEISVLYMGLPNSELDNYLQLAIEHNWWVIWSTRFDLHDIGVSQYPELVKRTVVVGGLEAALPGWRVGWMAGSEMAGKLRSFKQSMTICSTSVSQWAALGEVQRYD